MQKTVLITGGAGFIGSNFVNYLLRHYPDYRLVVVDQLTYAGSTENLPAEFAPDHPSCHQFWYGNICNAELMNSLVADAHIVVHFAAESHVTRSIFDNQQFFQTDVMGSYVVANAVLKVGKRVERLIHISTSEVYGTAETERMDETHPLNPMSPYASAKCGADRLFYSYWKTYQLPIVIVRPFNNYGPRQHLEKVVPRFIVSGIEGMPMTVHGDGQAARDFLYVEDHCRALDLILHAPSDSVLGEVFNIATDEHHSILDIARDLIELMHLSDNLIEYRGNRPGQVARHTGNSDKIRQKLGWHPATSWKEGLQETIEWYRKNQVWWKRQEWMRTVPIVTASGQVELH